MKKTLCSLFLVFAMLLLLASCSWFLSDQQKYEKALALIEKGKYEKAYALLEDLGDFQDAKALCERFHYVPVRASGNNYVLDYSYNENNLLSRRTYSEGDQLVQAQDYIYDEKGNLIKETDTYRYESGVVGRPVVVVGQVSSGGNLDATTVTTTEYTYDENNNLVKKVETSHNESGFIITSSVTEYTYDKNDNLIKKVQAISDQSVFVWTKTRSDTSSVTVTEYTYITEYAYSERGNLIKETSSRVSKTNGLDNATQTTTIEYVYNENDNLIKTVYYSGGIKVSTTEYVYNKNNKVLKETSTDETANHRSTCEYTYDKNDNPIKTVYYSGGIKVSTTEYVYNKNNKVLKVTSTDETANHRSTCEYTYDKNDNPIKTVYTDSEGNSYRTKSSYKLVYIPFDLSELPENPPVAIIRSP